MEFRLPDASRIRASDIVQTIIFKGNTASNIKIDGLDNIDLTRRTLTEAIYNS